MDEDWVYLDLPIADIQMYLEMWQESPDGKDHIKQKLDQLPESTLSFNPDDGEDLSPFRSDH